MKENKSNASKKMMRWKVLKICTGDEKVHIANREMKKGPKIKDAI